MNKKLLFNHLLLHYNKSIGKLKRLSEKGLNFRRQTILGKRIERIKRQLISIKYALTKGLAMASFAGGVAMLQAEIANAQNFQPPVVNPFSLENTLANINSVDYADLDSDGDIDAIVYSSILSDIYIMYNIGSPEIPEFQEPTLIPISSINTELLNKICLGDLDSDGDYDLMAGKNDGSFIYFENIGTENLLEFSDGILNPFSLTDIYDYDLDYQYGITFVGNNFIELVDIDGDSDIDIYTSGHFYYEGYYGTNDYDKFRYIENIGTPELPAFIANEFEFPGFCGKGSFADFDLDGDFDYISKIYKYEGYYNYPDGNFIRYNVNGGSNLLPQLGFQTINPFGLGSIISDNLFSPALADLDNDNDLDLMLLKAPNEFFFFENRICDSTNTNITDTDGVLTAVQSNAQYQWYYVISSAVDILIEGETNQSYIPINSGEYFVQINNDGCVLNSNAKDFITCNYIIGDAQIFSLNNQQIVVYYDDYSDFVGQYRWLDCNNSLLPIFGEINEIYQPAANGDFAVEITEAYCKDTTDCYNFTFCETLSVNIEVSGNNLIAQQSGGSYQWIDCDDSNLPINGETNQIFAPQSSGSYAVEIIIDNCTITTECVNVTITNINDFAIANKFSIVPNPTNGNLNVNAASPLLNAVVQIKSIGGQIVAEQNNISGSSFVFDLANHVNGLYFIEVTDGGFTTHLKIVKE